MIVGKLTEVLFSPKISASTLGNNILFLLTRKGKKNIQRKGELLNERAGGGSK